MKNLADWISGKSEIDFEESTGIGVVVQAVEKHPRRTFKVAWPGNKSSQVPAEEVVRFVREELPGYYDYYVKIKTYVDRHKIRQTEIEIQGTAGVRGKPGRYNPFDTRFFIKTEKTDKKKNEDS
jgi:hypothetical protein